MKKSFGALALLFALIVLSSCGSTRPIKYFTLNPTPTPTARVSEDSKYPATILVGRITANHLYRDDRIVYGTGGVELGAYEYNRWVEMPTEMLETMLVQKLRSKDEFRSVARISGNMRAEYLLRGHLYSLEEIDASPMVAKFSISVELVQIKTNTVVWNDSYTHDQPIPKKTMTDVVEAMRQNVDGGLDQLSSDLEQFFASQPAH
jgi:ABC-type uncharacterized transport system auxiliary subunit